MDQHLLTTSVNDRCRRRRGEADHEPASAEAETRDRRVLELVITHDRVAARVHRDFALRGDLYPLERPNVLANQTPRAHNGTRRVRARRGEVDVPARVLAVETSQIECNLVARRKRKCRDIPIDEASESEHDIAAERDAIVDQSRRLRLDCDASGWQYRGYGRWVHGGNARRPAQIDRIALGSSEAAQPVVCIHLVEPQLERRLDRIHGSVAVTGNRTGPGERDGCEGETGAPEVSGAPPRYDEVHGPVLQLRTASPKTAESFRSYCTALIMSKIGRYMLTTIPPTTAP